MPKIKIKAALTSVTVAAAATAAVLAVPASPAQAYNCCTDIGDGSPNCNQYEICLRRDQEWLWDYDGYMSRDFYWGNMHHGQETFMYDPEPWRYNPATFLMDNVVGVWNRDSTCDVKLWDYDGRTGWYTYSDVPRGWRVDWGDNRNNGHSRC
jgi:hypothetical protein